MVNELSLPKIQFITGTNPRLSHAEEARKACRGGIRFIQFREKNATLENCKRMAETTLEVCKQYAAYLIVNDYIEVAQEIKADGVHLGYNDESPSNAREVLGKNAIIGGTGNAFEDIQALHQKGINYLGVGPLRYTSNKDKLKPFLGMEGYKKIISQMKEAGIDLPVYAVGGIQLSDIPDLLGNGVHGLAVASSIGRDLEPEKAASEFVQKMEAQSV